MSQPSELSDPLRERLRGLAERTGRPVADILREALEEGHSLRWQERFHERVEAGIMSADAGDFATEAEIEAVRNKYRPA